METRLDGLAGNAQAGGGLVDAHLLDGAQHEDAAEGDRQLVHRRLDGTTDFLTSARLLRARLGRAEPRRTLVSDEGFGDIVDIDGPPAAAQPPQRLVGDDAGETGGEARFALKPSRRMKART